MVKETNTSHYPFKAVAYMKKVRPIIDTKFKTIFSQILKILSLISMSMLHDMNKMFANQGNLPFNQTRNMKISLTFDILFKGVLVKRTTDISNRALIYT